MKKFFTGIGSAFSMLLIGFIVKNFSVSAVMMGKFVDQDYYTSSESLTWKSWVIIATVGALVALKITMFQIFRKRDKSGKTESALNPTSSFLAVSYGLSDSTQDKKERE